MALLSIILTVAHVELCTDRRDPCFLGTSQVPLKGSYKGDIGLLGNIGSALGFGISHHVGLKSMGPYWYMVYNGTQSMKNSRFFSSIYGTLVSKLAQCCPMAFLWAPTMGPYLLQRDLNFGHCFQGGLKFC